MGFHLRRTGERLGVTHETINPVRSRSVWDLAVLPPVFAALFLAEVRGTDEQKRVIQVHRFNTSVRLRGS